MKKNNSKIYSSPKEKMESIEQEIDQIFEDMTEKQKNIYDAAVDLFAEFGYAGTSTNQIARKAGVAEGLIFKHFQSKQKLFNFIALPVIQKVMLPVLRKKVITLLDKEYPDFKIFLKAIFLERVGFAREHTSMLKIWIQAMLFNSDLRSFAEEKLTSEIFPVVSDFIRQHQDKGILKKVEPQLIFRSVLSSILGFVIVRVILFPDKKWKSDEKEVEDLVQIMFDGIKK